MNSSPHFCLLILALLTSTLFAVEVRIATFNVRLGLEDTNELGRINAEAVLARINADIVGLQEVNANDLNNGHLADLANNLNYPHIFIPQTALDTSTRVVILSKFPFAENSSTSILSPSGANDVTRAAPAVVVDVPNTTNDPTIIAAHLKCCFETDDPFRRAVEMARIRNYLEAEQLDGNDNIFLMGDFNLLGQQNITFSSLPAGLPPSYVLGNDISFDVTYFTNPTDYFPGLGIVNPGATQQDGVTISTFGNSSTILDYLLISSSLAARNPVTEVYNSNLESSFPGLPKFGSPLAANASTDASDHFPVFGDFNLDDGLRFSLTSNQATLNEDSPPAVITTTLISPATQITTITLQLNDPSEATLAQTTLTIPIGQVSASTTLTPRLDQISDGDQTIQITASSPGYEGALTLLTIQDADPQFYEFTSLSQAITEDFGNFDGSQKPAAWADGDITWLGTDDGSSPNLGARSYQGSLGLLNTASSFFITTLKNNSGQNIPAIEISYDAQHWRRSTDGAPDRLEASVVRNGITTRLPALNYTPSLAGPSGQLTPPPSASLSTYLRDLQLAPGDEIDLIFEMVAGISPSDLSDDVFINEFHYDNAGDDTNEFVEVLVGANFTGNISGISIYFYNGNGGGTYDSAHSLDTFIESPQNPPEGPRLFHKFFSQIQNGSPDGIALVIDGVVREFISYEGSFTATNGPAVGIVSTSVGASQSNSTPVAQNSIARTGTGSRAEDFSWGIQPGPHTPGALNLGQTLGASPQPQGLAIDKLIITPLVDSDGDLLPDIEEESLGTNPLLADSDHDGQDDFFEAILVGTDPNSPASLFKPTLSVDPTNAQLSFPTSIGRNYQVESSTDLDTWLPQPVQAGDGNLAIVEIPASSQLFLRVRISLP